ncbi:MAG: type II toxin-antitoxin system VapC family toxin [Myxococcota bacterium]
MKLIVDTGPLVALLDRRDPLHTWAKEIFEELAPPYLTCDAVLTEASHFVGDSTALSAAWRAGELVVEFESRKHRERICALMERYEPNVGLIRFRGQFDYAAALSNSAGAA